MDFQAQFLYACKNSHLERAERLLLDGTFTPDSTIIEWACTENIIPVVRLLLKHPAVIVIPEVFEIVADKGYLEILSLLLPYGDPSRNNNAALFNAAAKGHLAIVELLLEDPRVSVLDKHDEVTSLEVSLINGYFDVGEVLLKATKEAVKGLEIEEIMKKNSNALSEIFKTVNVANEVKSTNSPFDKVVEPVQIVKSVELQNPSLISKGSSSPALSHIGIIPSSVLQGDKPQSESPQHELPTTLDTHSPVIEEKVKPYIKTFESVPGNTPIESIHENLPIESSQEMQPVYSIIELQETIRQSVDRIRKKDSFKSQASKLRPIEILSRETEATLSEIVGREGISVLKLRDALQKLDKSAIKSDSFNITLRSLVARSLWSEFTKKSKITMSCIEYTRELLEFRKTCEGLVIEEKTLRAYDQYYSKVRKLARKALKLKDFEDPRALLK